MGDDVKWHSEDVESVIKLGKTRRAKQLRLLSIGVSRFKYNKGACSVQCHWYKGCGLDNRCTKMVWSDRLWCVQHDHRSSFVGTRFGAYEDSKVKNKVSKLIVKDSNYIHAGKGVFAIETIPNNCCITEYSGKRVSRKVIKN